MTVNEFEKSGAHPNTLVDAETLLARNVPGHPSRLPSVSSRNMCSNTISLDARSSSAESRLRVSGMPVRGQIWEHNGVVHAGVEPSSSGGMEPLPRDTRDRTTYR
jgi:hypothetical protein